MASGSHTRTGPPSGRGWIGSLAKFWGPEQNAAITASDLAVSGAFIYLLEPAGPSIDLLDLDGGWRERVDLSASLEDAGRPAFLASRLLVSASGDLWLFEPRSGGLLHFDRLGRFLDAPLDLLAGNARTLRIADAAIGPDGGVILLDAGRGGILPLDASGGSLPFETLGSPLAEPAALAVDRSARRYVLEASGRLRIFEPGGGLFCGMERWKVASRPARIVSS